MADGLDEAALTTVAEVGRLIGMARPDQPVDSLKRQLPIELRLGDRRFVAAFDKRRLPSLERPLCEAPEGLIQGLKPLADQPLAQSSGSLIRRYAHPSLRKDRTGIDPRCSQVDRDACLPIPVRNRPI